MPLDESGESWPHQPVLYQTVIDLVQPQPSGRYVDATLGAGGHAEGILQASAPSGLLLGLDVDPHALRIASKRLESFAERIILCQASYTELENEIKKIGWRNSDGILFDLGVSSMQIDAANRGFSFLHDGPLDMRFNPLQKKSAADIVNQTNEEELAKIIWEYGEEPQARRIAAAIIKQRPFHSTLQLAEVISNTVHQRKKRIHPATRTFQAIRMAVNDELVALELGLKAAVNCLAEKGKLVVITFHSLEDRLVKQYIRRESQGCVCPPTQPVCTCHHIPRLQSLTTHAIQANEDEIRRNPRARSARLRAAEKITSESQSG